jgi:uncharacterized tellurite resistance protein B-like protein
MIKRLIGSVVDAIGSTETEAEGRDEALRIATAVLLIDVARADSDFSESEFDTLLELIATHFELPPQDAAELVIAANEKADHLVSVHEFTQLLHQHLSEEEKARIVGLLWKIAFADGRLDKYENSLVLKISDLLYVSRGRVMRLKHDAQVAAG